MFVINLTSGSKTTTALTFTQALSTNGNVVATNNSTIQIKAPGAYEVNGYAVLSSSGSGNCGITLEVNGNAANNYYFSADSTTATETVPINAVLNVLSTTASGYVTLQFMPMTAPTIEEAEISIKKIS